MFDDLDGKVATRFPPEPNGYLHLGHAKSIHLNFGLARKHGGTCNLRFDDTNPSTEDEHYVDAILADVRWLGFEPDGIYHASDYFERLFRYALKLIVDGKAYVDFQSPDEIRESRGTVTMPGTNSPWRDRTPEENSRILMNMRAGGFPEGTATLRAKIDMAHPNMKMRDPLMYRIKHEAHHRTGDKWCIYPMYDWAHGQSDAIEGITHSICTLEFENNREVYDWFLEALGFPEPPKQIEFARLSLTYTVLSKRHLKDLVQTGNVGGWDDPRMPTIAGLRNRGVTPEAIATFCERIGVARANSVVDIEVLDGVIREDLNRRVPRRMAVLDPLEVVIENWTEGTAWFEGPDYPNDVGLPGSRRIPFSGRIVVDRSDFSLDPPKGWHRLTVGGEVRLRHGHILKCTEAVMGADGTVESLRATLDLDTLGKPPEGRKVRGVIHWVDATHGLPCEFRILDRLFTAAEPGARTGDVLDDFNHKSLTTKVGLIEPAVETESFPLGYQFERVGYFKRIPGSILAFSKIVGLKEGF